MSTKIAINDLLAYRAEGNFPLFAEAAKDGLQVKVQATEGIVLEAFLPKHHPQFATIRSHSNKYLKAESLMLSTHDFADPATWEQQDPLDSLFVLKPNDGYKLIITSIVARFSDVVDLAGNNLNFTIYKYIPQYGAAVPVVTDSYTSIQKLLTTSNSWWHTVEFTNSNAFQGQMLEVKFRYAADDTDDWSKLTLSSSLNERIECRLSTQEALKASGGAALQDPCYSLFNTKRVLEF